MQDRLVRFNITARNMTRIFWLLFSGPFVLYMLLNIMYTGFEKFWINLTGINTLMFFGVLLITYLAHELLHVIGGLSAGASLRSFSFEMDRTTLSIECGCNEEITVDGYKRFLLLPCLVLTPLFVLLSYSGNSQFWPLMLVMSTSGCAFDLTLYFGLRGIPGDTRIIPELEGADGFVYVKSGG